ncbi:hypothetical protein F2Q69_00004212 [Brassica cretica]|uniref:Uncharacterized protein n=1 Tax=Brassica cretica TaxID=69181 RepID=A0A8S9NL36_BRACR|nr:hypothetical protein F2Q69_00004212 [Brassica cretica]
MGVRQDPECSEAPLPNDFCANLPPNFTIAVSLDEAPRREVVAEGSRSLIQRLTEVSERRVCASFALQGRRDREEVLRIWLRRESTDRLSPIPELSFVRRGKGEGRLLLS